MAKTSEDLNDERASRKKNRSTNSEGCVRSGTFKRTAESKPTQLHHLPVDVLRSILSRLTFRESWRMGVLSHDWQRLSGSCCPKMVFTRATMFRSGGASSDANTRRTRTNFATRVNNALRQLRSPAATLNKFVVKFGLRRKHASHVDGWVHFCAASRARHVTLDFTPGVKGSCRGYDDDKYIFPLHVFTGPDSSPHIKSLRLGLVYLNLATPSLLSGFANLKKLSLHKISFSGDLQFLLLPVCAVLEWLSISYCSLHCFTVSRPLCRLQYLRVHFCMLDKIELQAPNLATFRFTDQPALIALGESPKMAEANIELMSTFARSDNLIYAYTNLVTAIPYVQKLSITTTVGDCHQFGRRITKIPARFINLRHLVLTLTLFGDKEASGGILRLAYFLELAPVLEVLELHIRCFGLSLKWTLDGGNILPHPHDNLKRVHMSGVCTWVGLIELALYILRSARRLDRMIIDPMIRPEGGSISCWTKEDIKKGRKMAKKLLEREEFQDILTIL